MGTGVSLAKANFFSALSAGTEKWRTVSNSGPFQGADKTLVPLGDHHETVEIGMAGRCDIVRQNHEARATPADVAHRNKSGRPLGFEILPWLRCACAAGPGGFLNKPLKQAELLLTVRCVLDVNPKPQPGSDTRQFEL